MRKLVLSVALAAALTACQTTPGVQYDAHTGATIVHSAMFNAASGLLHSLSAAAGYEPRVGYVVVVRHLSTGLGWSHFRSAWSFGKQYTYVVSEEELLGCSSGCSMRESGVIRIPEPDFQRFAQTGFEFKLVGLKNSIVGKVPPEAFRQVLERVK